MSCCLILTKQFENALVYLNSIQCYMENNDDFNWNYGISLASSKDYVQAEEKLLKIQSEYFKNDPV